MTTDLRARQRGLARQSVLDGVLRLLETASPGEVSMPEVAAAAGMSLRTLYRYFPTRDDLLAAAGDEIARRLGLPSQIASAADIAASFWDASGRYAEHPQLARTMLHTAAGRAARHGHRRDRTRAVEAALEPITAHLGVERAAEVKAVIAHLCSVTSWVSMAEESQLSDEHARSGVVWAIETLVDVLATQTAAEAGGSRVP